MSDPAQLSIQAMRRATDELVARVRTWDEERLRAPSACSEWTVAQVLSHLGSGAEIGLHTLTTGKADPEAAPAVWARWDAMSPVEQAAACLDAGERLVEAFESQDEEARLHRTIDVGYLPLPVDIALVADLRLSELALHGWDVDVPFDPDAVVAPYLVPFVLGRLPLFAGFFAQPIGTAARVAVTTADPDRTYLFDLGTEGATLTEEVPSETTASLALPGEAFVRLTSGRLGPEHTPAGVSATGDLTLGDFRRIFPGY
ncbi:MAG TPA: maleylpyruvate isomerase family mycothiol-dependent enzyme [Acidimicrobiales bacterium]|nr:maleylpyruvate isomerase family mycothiol-dependent enzyme [Acidimicrobiales bacterium]